MFKIIGGDGKEYGPVSAEQVRQWVLDGRANKETKIQPEGTDEWKKLSEFPEFADLFSQPQQQVSPEGAPSDASAAQPSPLAGAPMPVSNVDAMQQVQGPAIGLIVVAILMLLGQIAGIVLQVLGISLGALGMQGQDVNSEQMAWMNMMSGAGAVVGGIIGIAIAVVILIGALKMKKLESYAFSMVSSILVMLPCSLCCVIGIPIGIWALVVMNKPEVKSAFH